MNLKDKRVLITGADGFIGSHLTERLLGSAGNVRALVMYNSFGSCGWLDEAHRDVKKNIEVFSGDIRDPFFVKRAATDCDVIFHLAALIAIPYSYHAPMSYVETNIVGTLNVLQAARDLDLERIVQTSTSEVYGTAQYVPISEEHPLVGQSPYAASKIGADQMALSFHKSFGTPVSVIRPFNTYGPRQSARAVIPTIITQIAHGKKVIQIGSLSPTRDFTFVEDTVEGFIRIGEVDEAVGNVINIGSNFEVSIGKTFELISNLMNSDVKAEVQDVRLRPPGSEVERLYADNSKARTMLQWTPRYSDEAGFKAGLRLTIDWFSQKQHLENYQSELFQL